EWLDNQQGLKPNPALHRAWIEYVLGDLLGFEAEVLKPFAAMDDEAQRRWSTAFPEHDETLRPDYVVIAPPANLFASQDDAPSAPMLVQALPPDQKLDAALKGSTWSASPAARMQELLHAAEVRLGLLTNGEQWMLVDAPRGETTGYISWYAELWFDEHLTLRAFTTLLSSYRFFGVPDDETLGALLAESAGNQQEVTDQLGMQVRHALELLVQAIDGSDRDAQGVLLQGISMSRLYEAAVTVMMRLVFLLSAEERGLLPLEDPLYAENYAVSTLHDQLRAGADQTGEEVLEYRFDAWPRLLATFHAVYGGVYHDRWHMPAYGGGLFDPDRFPFLEGRRSVSADDDGPNLRIPLNIDNRTALHLLESLQYLQVRVPGAGKQLRRLSFRALDIEQIGHVYEGLLDHTAKRADTPVLGLAGSRQPEVSLDDLEAFLRRGDHGDAQSDGQEPGAPAAIAEAVQADLLKYLKDETGRTPNALRNALNAQPPDSHRRQALMAACDNDEELYARVLPWHGLIRDDDYGRPIIINAGSAYVTAGAERRATGTHYTPRSLTEPIVQHTLEPLVYVGPAQGKPREEWALHTPQEILNLKVCDMAMGSGAFLVQACRYLSERLVEAVEIQDKVKGRRKQHATDALETLREAADEDERLLLGRRLVASRCLYGVDKNPLAVEMAKLSLWLITMDKNRAFNFLDHALKCGDSLVGVDLDQLRTWSLEGSGERRFETVGIELDIEKMVQLRREIEAMPVLDIRDQQAKAHKLAQADAIAHELKRAGDLLVQSYYNTLKKTQQNRLREHLLGVARGNADVSEEWSEKLSPVDYRGDAEGALRPFHWPLEFPEVFQGAEAAQSRAHALGQLTAEGTLFGGDGENGRRSGFDAIVGNPPFVGGKRIRQTLGDPYRTILYGLWKDSMGGADYCAFFFLQGYRNLGRGGAIGLIATNTIAQGDTRLTGLAKIEEEGGTIFRAVNNAPWPGQAAVAVDIVHIGKGSFLPPFSLNGVAVQFISSQLDDRHALGEPYALAENQNSSFVGSFVNGIGFVLEPEEAEQLLARDDRNRDVIIPYLSGQDLNSNPDQSPNRYVINFFDWPRERTLAGSWYALDEQEQKKFAREGVVPRDFPGPVAADYPVCFAIVEERVYPIRKNVNRKAHRKYWWHYGDKRPALYDAIVPFKHVILVPETTKYCVFSMLPTGIVYAHMVKVIASDSYGRFALLSSTVHESWARHYSGTLEMRLKYNPSDCLENFPFPDGAESLESLGRQYDDRRRQTMVDRWEGLTDTYNRFHDPEETAADIARLRQLHVEMDNAVVAAYGWQDLDLGHDFHETQQGVRYTIHEEARREVLTRLLALNHERYAEEVAAGLHDKKKGKSAGKKRAPKSQMDLL
ncbi:hypothetical protein LCGC14_1413540, partial [marine sediment metagenome]